MAETAVDPAELERLGLYDPDAPDAADRLELIRYLFQLGATVEDLEAAEGELPGVASMLALRGRPSLTMSEVAARAGLPTELAERFYRAAGFPDPGSQNVTGTEEDVEALRTLRAGIELLGLEEMMQLVRVLGSSLARIADAMVSTFIVNVGAPSLDEDPSGLALARANAEGGAVLRAGGTAIDYLLRRHIEVAQRPLVLGVEETQPLTVGFVDLVGSTALAQQMPIGELGAMLAAFDQLTSDLIVDGGGRLVKLIGDEVMFVAADPSAACEIALALAEQLAAHGQLPPARGALATGEILTRDGDYFGPPVNLAARAVKLAEPSTVLASDHTARAAPTGYTFTPVGAQRLKGFDEPVELFRLDRAP